MGLAGEELAIVTDVAGTTRDTIRQAIDLGGVPVYIVDTAGLRQSEDPVERLGIERTWGEVGKADVILHMLDANHGPTRADESILAGFPAGVPVLRIWNKIDLSGHKPSLDQSLEATHIYLSAHDHLGIDLLRAELLRIAGWQQTGESLYLARERHLIALKNAARHLDLHLDRPEPGLDHVAVEPGDPEVGAARQEEVALHVVAARGDRLVVRRPRGVHRA